jgi:hypothetical protein
MPGSISRRHPGRFYSFATLPFVLVSPVAARVPNDPLGTVKGKDALRAYFKKALEAYPNLKFDFLEMMRRLSSVVL